MTTKHSALASAISLTRAARAPEPRRDGKRLPGAPSQPFPRSTTRAETVLLRLSAAQCRILRHVAAAEGKANHTSIAARIYGSADARGMEWVRVQIRQLRHRGLMEWQRPSDIQHLCRGYKLTPLALQVLDHLTDQEVNES